MSTPVSIYQQILEQIQGGNAILFLGAGITVFAQRPDGKRGVDGRGLAQEILRELNDGKDPDFRGVAGRGMRILFRDQTRRA
jgi:hypothetical protein